MTADTNAQTDEIPFFPAPAPAALADPGTARAMLLPVLDDLAAVVTAIGDDDLARPRTLDRDVFDRERSIRLVQNGGAHGRLLGARRMRAIG